MIVEEMQAEAGGSNVRLPLGYVSKLDVIHEQNSLEINE